MAAEEPLECRYSRNHNMSQDGYPFGFEETTYQDFKNSAIGIAKEHGGFLSANEVSKEAKKSNNNEEVCPSCASAICMNTFKLFDFRNRHNLARVNPQTQHGRSSHGAGGAPPGPPPAAAAAPPAAPGGGSGGGPARAPPAAPDGGSGGGPPVALARAPAMEPPAAPASAPESAAASASTSASLGDSQFKCVTIRFC